MAPRLSRCVTAAATAASGFVVADQWASGVGRLMTIAFVVAIPAIAISSLLPRTASAPLALVAITGAVSINAVVAQTMLSVDRWSPPSAVVIIGFVAALLWLIPPASSESSVSGRGRA